MVLPIAAAEAFSIACAVTSTVVSFFVILTGILFPSMRSSVFMRTIMTIATCDFFGCLVFSFGFPSDALCSAQGFIGWLFIRGSWFFTVCLSLQLCSLVLFGRIVIRERVLHAVSWCLTIFLTCIPFAGHFDPGLDDVAYGTQICFLASGPIKREQFNIYNNFYFTYPLVCSLVLLFILSIVVRTYSAFHIGGFGDLSSKRVDSLIFAIQLYPLALLLAWLPNAIVIFYLAPIPFTEFSSQEFELNAYTTSTGALYGALLGLTYFSNSREARQRWYYLVTPCKKEDRLLSHMLVDIDSDLVSSIAEWRSTHMTMTDRPSEAASWRSNSTGVRMSRSVDVDSDLRTQL